MGRNANTDAAADSRKFFDDDGVFNITHAGTAIGFWEDNAHHTHLAKLLHDGARENLFLIPGHHMRTYFFLRKFSDFAS